MYFRPGCLSPPIPTIRPIAAPSVPDPSPHRAPPRWSCGVGRARVRPEYHPLRRERCASPPTAAPAKVPGSARTVADRAATPAPAEETTMTTHTSVRAGEGNGFDPHGDPPPRSGDTPCTSTPRSARATATASIRTATRPHADTEARHVHPHFGPRGRRHRHRSSRRPATPLIWRRALHIHTSGSRGRWQWPRPARQSSPSMSGETP